MPRRREVPKRRIIPDPKFKDKLVAKFMNSLMIGGKKATATAAGLFDGMQYLTAFVVGPGVPLLTKQWGWEAWHWAPIPFALIGAALMGTLWSVTPSRKAGH